MLLQPPGVDSPSFLITFMEISRDGEKSYSATKNVFTFPIRKISLNRFKSFAIKTLIFSPSNSSFQVITLFPPSFHSLPFPWRDQCYFKNPASINACFPLFHTPFFISNFIKFELTPFQLGFRDLWANQL